MEEWKQKILLVLEVLFEGLVSLLQARFNSCLLCLQELHQSLLFSVTLPFALSGLRPSQPLCHTVTTDPAGTLVPPGGLSESPRALWEGFFPPALGLYFPLSVCD